jgi:hypothetical protein
MLRQAIARLTLTQPTVNLRQYGSALRAIGQERLTPELRMALMDYALGPLTMVPGVLLLLAIHLTTAFAGWSIDQTLALGVGLTTGMLAASVFLPAIGRRASIYIATDDHVSLRHYAWLTIALLFAGGLVASALIYAATGVLGLLTPETRIIFAVGSLSLGCVWLLGGWLSLLRQYYWLLLSLAIGLVTYIAVNRILALLTPYHIAPAALAGVAVAIGIEARALTRRLGSVLSAPANSHPALPAPAYIAWEATPYLAHGAMTLLFILSPHTLGWLGVQRLAENQLLGFAHVQIALTLALPPIALATGVIERTLRVFWRWTKDQLEATDGNRPGVFCNGLLALYRRQLGVLLSAMLGGSLLVLVAVGWATTADVLPIWLAGFNLNLITLLVAVSLVGYSLLAWAYLNGALCVTLNCPAAILPAGLAGLLTMAVVGVPLCLLLGYGQAIVAFLSGAFVYAVLSTRTVIRVLSASDYHFFASG